MNNIKNRTLGNLWETLPGKIVIYLENDAVKEQFVADAAADGYTVNGAKPTKDNVGQIILLRQHSLSNLGLPQESNYNATAAAMQGAVITGLTTKSIKTAVGISIMILISPSRL